MFEIIYHFIGEEGILREIKWLAKSAHNINMESKENTYEWQWMKHGEKYETLVYIDTKEGVRIFKDGKLTFSKTKGQFEYKDKIYELERMK